MSVHTAPTNTLSVLVRSRRSSLGLSKRSAADKAGISEFQWNWIERAATPRLPGPEVVAGIAAALDLSPSELVRAAGYEVHKP